MILAHKSWGNDVDPVALLVHGGQGGARVFEELGSWFAGQGWHAIAVDWHGCGDTGSLKGHDLSIQSVGRDLVDTVAHLRPDSGGVDVLLGLSAGAHIALICVDEHPEFAQRVVLEDPGPGPDLCPELLRGLAEVVSLTLAIKRDPIASRTHVRSTFPDRPHESTDMIVDYALAVDLDAWLAVAGQVAMCDTVKLASECSSPLLVFLGRDKETGMDIGFDGYFAHVAKYSVSVGPLRERFCAALAHHTVIEMDTGHSVHRQDFPAYVGHLAGWLKSIPPPTPTAGAQAPQNS